MGTLNEHSKQICHQLFPNTTDVNMIYCSQQRESECGILSIANLVCLDQGINPGLYQIDVDQSRDRHPQCTTASIIVSW